MLAERGDVQLAFCWSHVRRRFYELAAAGPAPIASEALERIAGLYAIEKDIRGRSADERRAIRQEKSWPIVADLEPWLRAKLARSVKRPSSLRQSAMHYRVGMGLPASSTTVHRIDSNVVERSIRPIALNRKNALFAGSDGGGEHWAVVASLIETCKLNRVDPYAYLTDVISKIVNVTPTAASTISCPGLIPPRHCSKTWPENSAYGVLIAHKHLEFWCVLIGSAHTAHDFDAAKREPKNAAAITDNAVAAGAIRRAGNIWSPVPLCDPRVIGVKIHRSLRQSELRCDFSRCLTARNPGQDFDLSLS